MNLSNRLTFSLVFSVLLVAGFAVVPTVMAAEGGPTIASIVLDDSMTTGTDGPDNDAAMMDDNIPAKATVSDGKALLTTTGQFMGTTGTERADLVDTTTTTDGTFRLIVTFDQDVYNANTARPDAPNDPVETLRDQSATRALGSDDLSTADFTILSALGIANGMAENTSVSITGVTRVLVSDPTPAQQTDGDEVWHARQFYVTVQVGNAAYTSLPINIALVVNTNVIFGIGANRVISPFTADQPGLGNVGYNATTPAESDAGYRQYDFQVIARAVSTLTVAADLDRAIKSSERVTLTLTFDPALHDSDVPTRTNIMVDGGTILADDPTNDGDDGLYEVEPVAPATTPANNTQWKIVIVPDGGTGLLQRTITVRNAPGAAFTLMQTIQVDDRTPTTPTPTQGITITGTAPRDGAKFVATITYRIAPAIDLTASAVSVANGTKDDATFTKVSSTVYTIEIDPNNPTVDNPVTVTVSVGQFTQDFETTATPVPDPVDPNEPTVITLSVGVDAGDYLVVAPMGATSTGMADSALPTSVSTANGNLAMTADIPNLYSLLFSGGTVAVYVTADSDNNTADIIINEVMWARDEGAIGQDGEGQHQWIELYNNSAHDAAAGSITLQFRPKVAPAALAAADYGSRTDRLSNIERFGAVTGWRISSGKGQNGNSTTGSLKEFISMYRLHNKRGDNDGVNGANWAQSPELSHVNHRCTPGAVNTVSEASVTKRAAPDTFTPPKSHVIINEVHNNSNNDLDWLELRFLQKTNLENWTLSYVKTDFTEVEIMRFPKREFQANDILLIVNKDPRDTNLAAGQDVTIGGNNQARGALKTHKYWNPSNGNSSSGHYLDIPDYNGGNFLLILRTGRGWERLGTRDRLHDAVGRATLVRQTLKADTVLYEEYPRFKQIWETNTWPINGQNLRAHNAGGSNNDNAHLKPDRNFAVGSVWARSGTAHGWRKGGIYNPGNRGGLGYDRNVVANGTPGYDNGILKNKYTDLANGKVVVSELMLTTDNGRYPQWIELHNTSDNTVDLHADTDGNGARQGWSIRVENHRSDSWDVRRRDKLNVEVKFRDLQVRFIPPNQTILIVADKVRNSDSRYFPASRVASIWERANGQFKLENRRDTFLNPKGFLLEIIDGSGQVSDVVGNLDGKGPDLFDTANVDFDDPYSWNWPTDMDGNRRTSLIRVYDSRVPRPGTPDRSVEGSMRGAPAPIGTQVGKKGVAEIMYSWVHASDTKMAKAQTTWYGSEDDHGTPGHTTSTPLPVSLSSFRPALEEGQVVVRWTTESELDNAGFNIYRSDDLYGEFKQVNAEMIQGHGTTGERHTYKWVDTSAKPDTVYYYQIEDVSFAGERETLATTKLKGFVSAENKLTTTWGELKEIQ